MFLIIPSITASLTTSLWRFEFSLLLSLLTISPVVCRLFIFLSSISCASLGICLPDLDFLVTLSFLRRLPKGCCPSPSWRGCSRCRHSPLPSHGSRTSLSAQVLSAATIVAKHTSALCNSCRLASARTAIPTAKRQFVQSAKEVANSTANLVKTIKVPSV